MKTGSLRVTAVIATVALSCLLAGVLSPLRGDGQPPLIVSGETAMAWDCRLETGVNYFALPIVPYDASWEGLFGRYVDAIDEVAAYDAVERRWVAFHPEAPPLDETTHAPSLIFRVEARSPVVLHFEGARFRDALKRLFPLRERLRLFKGWNLLGASWDEPLDVIDGDDDPETPDLQSLLEAQRFWMGSDILRIFDGEKQIWEDLDPSKLGLIEPGRVMLACKKAEEDDDPYERSPSPAESSRPYWGTALAGRSFRDFDLEAVEVTDFPEDGEPFSFGAFKMAGHVFRKGADGKAQEGRCLVVLPETLHGFTDLPAKVWAKVVYSGDEVQKVLLDDVESVTMGPRTTQSKTVTAIDALYVTPEGLLQGRGTLAGQAVTAAGTSSVDVAVQILWNEAWPKDEERTMAALELQVPLEDELTALLRWERRDDTVEALDGWRVSFLGERAKTIVWSRVEEARELPFSMKATLSAVAGITKHDPWRPIWLLPELVEAGLRKTSLAVKSVPSQLVIPEPFPSPLAGIAVDGSFEKGTTTTGEDVAWRFVSHAPVNLTELVLLPPPPGPYEAEPTARVSFETIRLGMDETRQGDLQPFVEGRVTLTLGAPLNRFLGKGPGEPLVLAAEAALEGGFFRCVIDSKKHPLDFTVPLGSFGQLRLGLEELYVSSEPDFGSRGSVILKIIDFERACRFHVVFRSPDDFALSIDFEKKDGTADPFVFGRPGVHETRIEKLAYESMIGGRMGLKISGSSKHGSQLAGFDFQAEDFRYMPSSAVPPYGFPFFDEMGLRAALVGFPARGSLSFPFPKLPDLPFWLGLLSKVNRAFSEDRWKELRAFCNENEEQAEELFRGPTVGKLSFLLPIALARVLPNLPVVEVELSPEAKAKVLKLDLLPERYDFTSSFPDRTDGIVHGLKTLKEMMLAIDDPRKAIVMVPPEKREGSVDFVVPGFARSITAGYEIVADQVDHVSVEVAGTKEFARFHRLVRHVEENLPSLKAIAQKSAAPVSRTLRFTDDEGETFAVTNTDFYVNLRDFVEEGLALKKDVEILQAQITAREADASASLDFDERRFFAAHMNHLRSCKVSWAPSREAGVDALRAVHSDGREARIALHGLTAPFEVSWPAKGPSRFAGTMVFYGQAERAFDFEGRRHRLLLRNWIDKVGERLLLRMAGRVQRARGATDEEPATRWEDVEEVQIPDQWVYDMAEGSYNPETVVTGWELFHPLGTGAAQGQIRFTDYGTMKIEAPGPTVVTYQYAGSKLNKLRDALAYLDDLPIFDWDSNEYLLSTQFWVNLLDASASAAADERPWSIQGKAVRYVHDPSRLGADTGVMPDDVGDGILDVRLELQEIDYPLPGSSEESMKRQAVSVNSDISTFYFEGDCLFAKPFRLKLSSRDEDTGEEIVEEELIPDLLVLDGSQRARELLAQRKANPTVPMSIFKELHELGLSLSEDVQPMRINRMQLDVRRDYLQVLAQPKLIVVMNNLYGGEMLRIVEEDADQIRKLMSHGPYDDPDAYPAREGVFLVKCSAESHEATMNTGRGEDLLDFFARDTLLRTLDLSKPRGLVASFDSEGSLVRDRITASSDGAWQGALELAGLETPSDTELPAGMARLTSEGEKVLFHSESPEGKAVRFVRHYGGEIEVRIQNREGWERCIIELDEEERTTGRLRHPTGERRTGGFFVHGRFDLAQVPSVAGVIDFQGPIDPMGRFRFEGGSRIWIQGLMLSDGRFIVDSRDGLYVSGGIDTGLGMVRVEGRMGTGGYSLVGALDGLAEGAGPRCTVIVDPHGRRLRGGVYLGMRKLYHGDIRPGGTSFTIPWSVNVGRVGADAELEFIAAKDAAGRVTSWKVIAEGTVWVDLGWPYGRQATSFRSEVAPDGTMSAAVGPMILVTMNVVRFDIDWRYR